MTNRNPAVSVIIPTYNRAHIISRSIRSILNQTYNDFELIIVDDGSTDNTEEVVKNFNDKRIKYIVHKENMGASSALNTGINFSSGSFVTFNGSDDEWLPEKLEEEMKGFKTADSRVGVVYSALWEIYADEKVYTPRPIHEVLEGNLHDELIKGNFVNGLSLIKRSCFEKVGVFDEKLPAQEDWELYIRISKYYNFKFINKPLSKHYLSPDSLTLKFNVLVNSTKKIIEKHFDEFNKQKKSTAEFYRIIAADSCLNGLLNEGRNYYIRAIKKNPTNIHCYLGYATSFFGANIFKKILDLREQITKN